MQSANTVMSANRGTLVLTAHAHYLSFRPRSFLPVVSANSEMFANQGTLVLTAYAHYLSFHPLAVGACRARIVRMIAGVVFQD